MIAAIYQYRRFIVRSAWNEMRDRYAGSGIGVFWNILVPLIQIAIYVFIFSAIMGARIAAAGQAAPPRFAFVLFLCAGMLPWLAFADAISRGTQRRELPEHERIQRESLRCASGTEHAHGTACTSRQSFAGPRSSRSFSPARPATPP